jgi:hypothetical protein
MNLKEIEPPALNKLVGYLEAISDFIHTGELKWYFDVTLFEYEDDFSDLALIIKTAYPESQPEKAKIAECSIADLVETLNHELGRGLYASPILMPVIDGDGQIWRYLNECVHYERSRIFEYTTSESLDSFAHGGIIGNFAFVILDEQQHRCLLLGGGDCD